MKQGVVYLCVFSEVLQYFFWGVFFGIFDLKFFYTLFEWFYGVYCLGLQGCYKGNMDLSFLAEYGYKGIRSIFFFQLGGWFEDDMGLLISMQTFLRVLNVQIWYDFQGLFQIEGVLECLFLLQFVLRNFVRGLRDFITEV